MLASLLASTVSLNATFGAITLLETTTEDLVRMKKPVLVATGFHANSRHMWTLAGGGTIAVDGEAVSKGGYVVDLIAIEDWKGTVEQSLRHSGFGGPVLFVGQLSSGIQRQEVARALGLAPSASVDEPLRIVITGRRHRSTVEFRFEFSRAGKLRRFIAQAEPREALVFAASWRPSPVGLVRDSKRR